MFAHDVCHCVKCQLKRLYSDGHFFAFSSEQLKCCRRATEIKTFTGILFVRCHDHFHANIYTPNRDWQFQKKEKGDICSGIDEKIKNATNTIGNANDV